MKKVLLSISALVAVATVNAQTTVFNATNLADYETWSVIDLDQDGNAWGVYDFLTGNAGNPVGTSFDAQGFVLGSFSWDPETELPLTPDNWAISPAINLTGYNTASLSWGRAAVDADFAAENYSVYVVTAADATALGAALAAATPVYTETIEVGDEWLVRTVSIASFDNTANVYVAIRHHACTDEFLFVVDDIKITASGSGTASTVENAMNVNVYPNPAEDVLNIAMEMNGASVSVISMDGKVVASQVMNGTTATVDVANLVSGVYFYEVTAENGLVIRNSFVKK
jgi:hypothetical protein